MKLAIVVLCVATLCLGVMCIGLAFSENPSITFQELLPSAEELQKAREDAVARGQAIIKKAEKVQQTWKTLKEVIAKSENATRKADELMRSAQEEASAAMKALLAGGKTNLLSIYEQGKANMDLAISKSARTAGRYTDALTRQLAADTSAIKQDHDYAEAAEAALEAELTAYEKSEREWVTKTSKEISSAEKSASYKAPKQFGLKYESAGKYAQGLEGDRNSRTGKFKDGYLDFVKHEQSVTKFYNNAMAAGRRR